MISNVAAIAFLCSLLLAAGFIGWSLSRVRHLTLLHKLYIWLLMDYSLWAVTMLAMWLTPSDRIDLLKAIDAVTYLGIGMSAFYLMISLVIANGYDRLPRWMPWLQTVPVLTFLVVLTNDYHHLQYQVFSIVRSEIVFGPFVLVSGIYSYLCLIASCVVMVRYALRSPTRIHIIQSALLVLGGICPLVVSSIATFSGLNVPITLTPLSFLPVLLFNGIAIYRYNLLDIKPIATQHILDWISDCYLVLNEKGLVISYNQPFAQVFASRYGIAEEHYLKDCLRAEDVSSKTAIYNMMTAIDACRRSQSTVSYEQPATQERNGVLQKSYYVTDVSPLVINGQPAGYVIIFKDVTQLKRSMQQLQENESHMMEQERFAFLGQMMGGLAHNLKTPIMSISGCISAADGLVDECLASLGDPVVTDDDYREIYGEMRGWFQKIQDSTAYMSDIITTIKGQVANAGTFDESSFALDELFKRTMLLMRHELMAGGCTLTVQCNCTGVTLRGDINNLVQVLGNLISNAIYAQKQVGGGSIILGASQQGGTVRLYVKDTGPGIPSHVRERLFKEMVTSKGMQGSGLGLYISNAVVRGKFGGSMWAENDPDGGAVIGLNIPLDRPRQFQTATQKEGGSL